MWPKKKKNSSYGFKQYIIVSQTLKIIEKEMYTSFIFLSRIKWQRYLLYYVLSYMCGLPYCMYVKVHLKLSHTTSQLKDFKEFSEGPNAFTQL